jgi:hypothetical protein
MAILLSKKEEKVWPYREWLKRSVIAKAAKLTT